MSTANQPGATAIGSSARTSTGGGGGIPPILGRQRSLSHGQAPLSSTLSRSPPHVRHRIALGAPVPTSQYRVGGAGSLLGYPVAPNLPSLNPTTPPGTPITEGVPLHSIPGCGVLPLPPGTPSQRASQKKAVDHALEAERARIKDLEAKEKDMDADALRIQLKRERQHSTRLACDLAALWSSAVQSQANSEIEDESRMNALMRRLEKVQREKGKIIVELEREEEMVSQKFESVAWYVCMFDGVEYVYMFDGVEFTLTLSSFSFHYQPTHQLTNTLQKKLNEVRKEKAILEQQIEREHEEQARLARRMQDAATSGVDDGK